MDLLRGLDNVSIEAIGHVVGLFAVFVGIAGLMLSIGLADGFSITADSLSSLGTPEHGVAFLFNGTMIITGTLATVFFATLINRFSHQAQRIGTTIMMIASISLAAIGVFPTDHVLHVPVAVLFFVGISVGILITAYGDQQAGRHKRARVALNLILLHVVAWIFGVVTLDGIALPELVGALIYAIWVMLLVVQRGRDIP